MGSAETSCSGGCRDRRGAPSRAAVRALASAGFRWIDDETGAIRVTDLCVYHFGAREPLTVDALHFYWQD